jgi:hypothetical protein
MQVSRSAAASAVAVLLLLVGAIGFLLGRESGRAQARSELGGPDHAAPSAPIADVSPPPARREALGASPVVGASAESLAVREYFAQIATIQTAGAAGDANDVANDVLAAMIAGDPSSLDLLIKSASDGAARARRVKVPEACAGYHGRMVQLLDEEVVLVRSLKAAFETQDLDALSAIGAKAGTIQARVKALEDEGRSLKARFGVAD